MQRTAQNKELIPDLKQARLDRDRLCDRDFRPPEECRTALERTIRTAREAVARSAEEAVSIEQRGPTPAGPAPAGDAGNGETPGGRGRYAARLEPWESEAQKTKVLAILKEYGVEKADVFGSRTTFEAAEVREKPGKESDVDFAIWWRTGEHGFKKSYRLRRELEEACGRGIDLIEEPESHPNPLFVESWRMTRVPILRDRNGEKYWRTETVKEWNVITDVIPRVAKNAKLNWRNESKDHGKTGGERPDGFAKPGRSGRERNKTSSGSTNPTGRA